MTEVDNRVVSMDFDNQRFEAGVKESLGTIQRLNGVLSQLDGIDFSGLTTAVDNISYRVSKAGIAAAAFVSNITNRVTDAAINMVKSLTIGNISSGFANYETELKSVQNIMNATGDSMASVETELGRIRTYTDETSYSYSKMVETLSTFTSQKIPLQESADAVMGIANMLALSGVEAAKSEHAFTGFAKALAAGMSGQTWAYIATAQANTAQTKEILLEAAVAVGTLEKTEDGLYKTTKKASKAGQIIDINNFETTFSYDWLNTEALVHAFEEMGEYSTLLDTFIKQYKELSGETITVSDAMEMLDNTDPSKIFDTDTVNAYAAAMEEITGNAMTAEEALEALQNREETLSEKGFKAGQAYRTFADTLNATKTAVSSAIASIFKSIFGNTEQAKETWTAVGGWMYDVFAAPFYNLDETLKEWANGPGREAFMKGFYSLGDTAVLIIETIKEGFAKVFPAATVDDVNNLAEKFKELAENLKPSEEQLDKIRTISERVARAFSVLIGNIKDIGARAKKAFKTIIPKTTLDAIEQFATNMVTLALHFKMSDETLEKLQSTFEGLFAVVDIARLAFEAIYRTISLNWPSFQKFGGSVLDATSSLGNMLVAIRDMISENDFFYTSIKKIVDFVRPGFEKIRDAVSEALDSVKELLGIDFTIPDSIEEFKNALSDAFDKLTKKTSPFVTLLQNLYKIIQDITAIVLNAITKISTYLGSLGKQIQPFWDSLLEYFKKLKSSLAELIGEANIKKLGVLLFGIFTGNITWESTWLARGFQAITNFFSQDWKKKIKELPGKIKSVMEDLGGIIEGVEEVFSKAKNGVLTFLETFQNTQMTQQIRNMAVSLLILAGAMFIMASINIDKISDALKIIVGLAASLGILVIVIKKVSSMISTFKGGFEGAANIAGLSVAFAALSAVILSLAISMKIISTIPLDRIVYSVLSLAVVLAVLVVALAAIDKYTEQAIASAGAIWIVSVAIINLAAALLVLSLVNTTDLTGQMVALVVTLVFVGLAIFALGKVFEESYYSILAAAGSMLIASVAIGVLVIALLALSLVPAESLGSSFAVLAGTIIVLTVALAGLGLLGPVVLAGAGALLIASIAFIAIGAALIELSIALALFNNVGPTAIAALSDSFISLGGGLFALAMAGATLLVGGPGLIMGGKALLDIGAALILMNGIPIATISDGFLNLGGGLFALAMAGLTLLAGGPGLIMGGKALVNIGTGLVLMEGIDLGAMGDGFISLGGGLSALGIAGAILTAGVIGLSLGGQAIATLATGLLLMQPLNLGQLGDDMLVIAAGLTAIAVAGIALTTGLIGLGATALEIKSLAKNFKSAAESLSTIENIDLERAVQNLKDLGDNIKDYKSVSKDFKKSAKQIGEGIGSITSAAFGELDISVFEKTGTAVCDTIAAGMYSNKQAIGDAGYAIVSDGVRTANGALSSWYSVGTGICNGIISGINGMTAAVTAALTTLATSLPQRFQAILQIHSPSRVFERLSEFIPEGSAKGIQNGTIVAVRAMDDFGSSLVASAKGSFGQISRALTFDDVMDITPVQTMNNLERVYGKELAGPKITPRLDINGMSKELAAMEDLMSSMSSNNTITVTHKFEDLTVKGINNDGELKAVTTMRIEDVLASSMRRMYRV